MIYLGYLISSFVFFFFFLVFLIDGIALFFILFVFRISSPLNFFFALQYLAFLLHLLKYIQDDLWFFENIFFFYILTMKCFNSTLGVLINRE